MALLSSPAHQPYRIEGHLTQRLSEWIQGRRQSHCLLVPSLQMGHSYPLLGPPLGDGDGWHSHLYTQNKG